MSFPTLPQTMLAVAISRPGGPEVLLPTELPVPHPAPDEVVIAVAAAGVNAPDLGQRRGVYDPPPGASPLPGLEVAGRIAAVGSEVMQWRIGDPVVALCNGGGYAEYVAVPAGQVLPVPAGLSPIEAAALPETFFTVAQTLLLRAGLEPGMSVLIEGAAGGIGGAAIQIVRALGGGAIALVSTEEKAGYVRGLGAAAVVLRDQDVAAEVKAVTGGSGADRVIAMSGGPMLATLVAATARQGHVILLASLSGQPTELNAGRIVQQQLTVSGSTLRPQSSATKARIAAELRERIWPHIESGAIRPPRIATFPLRDAAAAHRALEDRQFFGKAILTVG